jgi:protein TonB
MKDSFLIGNFLPAYGDKFGKPKKRSTSAPGLSRQVLAGRFRERAVSYRIRRSEYVRGFQIGLIGALALTVAAFNVDYNPSSDLDFRMGDQELVAMEEIVQTLQVTTPPPPPRPPIPVEVPNDDILQDEDLDLDMSLDLDQFVAELPPPPAPPVEKEVDVEPEIFMVVEQMPELIGGLAALLAEAKYPPLAQKAGLEGVVVIQIIIDKQGLPSEPKVIKSVHKSLDDEAMRAVMAQKYRPGMQRGRPVKVAMNIPVTFRLN